MDVGRAVRTLPKHPSVVTAGVSSGVTSSSSLSRWERRTPKNRLRLTKEGKHNRTALLKVSGGWWWKGAADNRMMSRARE